MARHAEGDARDRRGFGIGRMPVAEEAVDAELPRMEFMAEIHGLSVLGRKVRTTLRIQDGRDDRRQAGQKDQNDGGPLGHLGHTVGIYPVAESRYTLL